MTTTLAELRAGIPTQLLLDGRIVCMSEGITALTRQLCVDGYPLSEGTVLNLIGWDCLGIWGSEVTGFYPIEVKCFPPIRPLANMSQQTYALPKTTQVEDRDEASSTDTVAEELKEIRQLTALSVNDIAQLCGIKRRHLYNLLDGGPTEPHRAVRIRRLAAAIERWSERFASPTALRSALFTPLDKMHSDFITLAASDEPEAVRRAIALFDEYVAALGGRRPITRTSRQDSHSQRESLRRLRELFGEESDPAVG